MPPSATCAWTASRPARPARSTTGARCRASKAYGVDGAVRLGRPAGRAERRAAGGGGRDGRCRAGCRTSGAGAACRRERRDGVQRRGLRRHRAALVGRAPVHQSLRPEAAEKSITATVVGNVRVTQVGSEYDTHHIVLGLRRDAVPGARRPVDRHPAARHRRPGPAAPRAPVLDRQPAQRRAAGLQQPVADHQARARRPPGQPGARRGQQLHVRPEGRRQGAGDRPVRRQLPDAQPPAERTS